MRRLLANTPLRVILIVPFVVQITAAVTITAWLSIHNGQKAVRDVAMQFLDEVSILTRDRIPIYLENPPKINLLHLRHAHLNLTGDIRNLSPHLVQTLRSFEDVSFTVFANPQGDYIGARRQEGDRLEIGVVDNATNRHLQYYSTNSQGEFVELLQDIELAPGDVLQRPWYQAAVKAQAPTWSEVYTTRSTENLAISATRPVYSDRGDLLGVFSTTISLEQIDRFLKSIEISKSGQVFILDEAGRLIASSTGERLYRVVRRNGITEKALIRAVESRDPLTQATAKAVRDRQKALAATATAPTFELTIEGERQFVKVTALPETINLNWQVVVVAPEADFMEQLHANTDNTVWLCLIALSLAAVSSILTARWISQPLQQLNQVAKRITQNTLPLPSTSFLGAIATTREVNELSQSFEQMTQQLQTSFAALQASEANFRNVAANVPGAIFRYILYADGTDAVLYMSPGCYQLWELSASAVEQDASLLWAMVDPEDLPVMQASVMQSAQTLATWNCQWRITTPSGHRKWLQGIGQPVRQPDESVLWHSVILDISDRKLAEIQLQDLTNRLELATRSAKIGIWDWDIVSDRLIWDDRMYDLYGLDPQDFNEVYAAWETKIHPEDLIASRTSLQQALKGEQDFNTEFRIVRPDGTVRYVEAHAIVQRDAAEQPIRMIGANLDISDRKLVKLALEKELFLSQTLFNTSIDGIVLLDSQGNVLQTSASFAQMLGYTIAETYRLNVVDWDAQWSRAELQSLLQGTNPLPPYFETRHRRKDGSVYDVEISYNQEFLNGETVHFCMCRDISNRKLAESERSRLINVLEASLNEIYLFNPDTLQFEYVNQGALQNLGYSLKQLQAMTPLDIKPDISAAEFEKLLTPLRQGQTPKINFETVHQRADGSYYPVEVHLQLSQHDGQSVFLAIVLDISDRKETEARLIHQALYDSLTDLPNRTMLTNRLESSIQRAKRSPTYHFAVLFLDLDRFKVINDSLGHLVGDELLITVAQKLRNMIRATDLAARLGGDEFVILLEHIPDIKAAIHMAERLLAAFKNATIINNHRVFVSTSIGIVWGTNAYTEASNLLRDADIALYRAKAKGRGKYEIFDVEMHVQTVKRMTLEQDLRIAIDRQEFIPYYQPIVDIKTRRIAGFEALIRWQHPTRGFVSPADFIPVAEETGLILPISFWMLQAACEQVAVWQQQFPDTADLRISINLSSQDLRQPSLVQMVQQTLQESQLPATSLTLEITESMLIENIEVTITRLSQLRDIGIRISIDDFGTGYSSLSYLYNLPANYLKIDQSFVSNMQMGDRNYKIVQAIVALSDQLELAAIAEGIETEQQLLWLKELGCELGQGYLLARPLAPEAVSDILAAGRIIR
ncbi:MAG: EAL domain-containing protein [Jaaginema sp. PMC 1079.18]|nr:EAL domain-containing protein [Jaaginema sp. PMC 1079.18]